MGGVVGIQPTSEEHRFPVLVRLGNSLHRQQVEFVILKDEWGGGLRRGDPFGPAQPECLAVDALRRAEPIDLDAEFGERLFDDPGVTGRSFDEDGPVGDTAGEDADRRFLVGAMRPVRRR